MNQKKKYRDLIKSLNIEDVFKWENKYVPDDEISDYFIAADVLALPYKSATQSGVVQIAYHYNKPVIVTDVGGLSEMVINNKTGNIIESENPIVLADTIINNFNNNNYLFMESYINEYKDNFSWDKFVKGIESLI